MYDFSKANRVRLMFCMPRLFNSKNNKECIPKIWDKMNPPPPPHPPTNQQTTTNKKKKRKRKSKEKREEKKT
jgi:hypothetical protein